MFYCTNFALNESVILKKIRPQDDRVVDYLIIKLW